jgi:hypothetical protein
MLENLILTYRKFLLLNKKTKERLRTKKLKSDRKRFVYTSVEFLTKAVNILCSLTTHLITELYNYSYL